MSAGVRRALLFSFAERYLLIIIGLASNLVIARLLTPVEIGVFSVSLAVISVAQVLRDFGVASYLVQEKELNDEHIRTALGVTLVIGGSLFVLMLTASPWVADFYREPQMLTMLSICALNFLLLPFSTISLALLRRQMAFKKLAAVGLFAATVGALVSTGLAWGGMGAPSLAIGSVATNAATGLAAWLARGERRLLWPGFSQWRSLMGFGAQSSAVGIVTSVSMDINDLAVGKVMGFEAVAIISRAQGLMNLYHRDIMGAVRNVAFPAFAKAVREKQNMEPIYLTSVTHVTVTAWPFYGFVALYGLETLRVLFGPQWDGAAHLVPWFCLAGALAACGSLIGNLIVAAGRMDLLTKVELVFQPLRAVMVVVAAVVFRSPLACAIAFCLAMLLQLPLIYWVKGRFQPNDWRTLGRQLLRNAVVCGAALMLPLGIALWQGLQRNGPMPLQWFLLAIFLCITSWLLALVLLRHPLALDPAFQRVLSRLGLRRQHNPPS